MWQNPIDENLFKSSLHYCTLFKDVLLILLAPGLAVKHELWDHLDKPQFSVA